MLKITKALQKHIRRQRRRMEKTTGLDLVEVFKQSFKEYDRVLTRDEEVSLAKEIEEGKKATKKMARGGLTEDETIVLAERIREGEESFKKMILHNLRLVMLIANSYIKHSPHLTIMDLIQEGYWGLNRAVEKFDYRLGYKLSTYATWWIKQAMITALDKQSRNIRVPTYMAELRRKISKEAEKLEQKIGRRPEIAEIVEETKVEKRMVEFALYKIPTESSLDAQTAKHPQKYLGVQSKNPSEEMCDMEKRDVIDKLMSCLNEQERHIITSRFGLANGIGLTLEETGKKYSLTLERIRQIEGRILLKMRRMAQTKGYDAKTFSFLPEI